MRHQKPNFPEPQFVTTSGALEAFCAGLAAEPFVTVDTEFIRERTYFPQLCLVQVAGATEVAVIDAEAKGIDLAPLWALLLDPRVVKVFHAARQDIEIVFLRTGQVPTPIFDTQIAAMVAGFGDQAAYDALVAALAGGHIDKAYRFTDWAARPLSPQQIAYAAADVTWLRLVYERLRTRLEREGRLDWVAEEMAELADPATYRPDPGSAWLRLKPRSSNRRYLAALRAAAAWREREAMRLDIPRQRVIKDESLAELAAARPGDAAGLARIRGFPRSMAEGRGGQTLLAALSEAAALPEAALPAPIERYDASRASPALVALLKVLLAARAEEHNVAPRLLASSEDLERLAAEEAPEVAALGGWRRRIFGEDALALKRGRLAVAVAGRHIRLVAPATPHAD